MLNIYALKQIIDDSYHEMNSIEENSIDDLKEIDWIGYKIMLAFREVCIENKLSINNFPPKNFTELENEFLIEIEDWEYYVNCCIVQNNELQEMYWYYYQLFWPQTFLNKKDLIDFLEIITNVSDESKKLW